LYLPPRAIAERVRIYIAKHYKQFQNIINNPTFKKTFGSIQWEQYKRVPKWFILNHQKNQWNEVFLDDWGIPTIWETVSTNGAKWSQISKAVRCAPNHKAGEFLKMKSRYIGHDISDKTVLKKDFMEYCLSVFKVMKPLNDFLNKAY
jgi:hypothetical protein